MTSYRSIWQVALEQKIVVEEFPAPLSLTAILLRVDSALTFLYAQIEASVDREDRH